MITRSAISKIRRCCRAKFWRTSRTPTRASQSATATFTEAAALPRSSATSSDVPRSWRQARRWDVAWSSTTTSIAAQRTAFVVSAGNKTKIVLTSSEFHECLVPFADDDINKLATCDFEGRTYREGERMFPKQKCYKCFCSKTFNEKTPLANNKDCYKIDCGIALTKTVRLSEGCIPVYIKTDDCCPVGWRCPGDKHMKGSVDGDTNDKCRFGNMMLKVGESLDLGGDNCQDCTCRLPPMLHCIQNCWCSNTLTLKVSSNNLA